MSDAPSPEDLIGFRDIHTPPLEPLAQLGDALAGFGVALLAVVLLTLMLSAIARRPADAASPEEMLRMAREGAPQKRLMALETLLRERGAAVPAEIRAQFYRPDALERLDEIEAAARPFLAPGKG